MRVLVTGGAGFIGSHLIDRLLEEGHEVRVLDNFASGRRENLLHVISDTELVEGDIRSYERAHTAVRGCDLVFHQAALPSVPRSVQDPLTTNAVNVVGTLNLLLAARDTAVQRVVMASSSSVYGANEASRKSEDLSPAPISPYAVGKLAAEGYCRTFSAVYGLETVCLRYFNIFGPRQDPLSQYAAVIPAFIAASLRNESPRVFGDGEQSRDFTYVANVVEANMLAAQREGISGQVVNVACGQSITIRQVLGILGELTGGTREPEYVGPRLGEVRHSQADISLARDLLSYEPIIEFREGLKATLEYFAAHSSNLVSPLS